MRTTVELPEQVRALANDVNNGVSRKETVRTVLSWFGAQRRGFWIVRDILHAFAALGITTVQSLDGTYIDGELEFQKADPSASSSSQPSYRQPETPIAQSPETPPRFTDPTFRLGRLDAANKPLVIIAPDEPIERAITIMIEHQFSQLPIMRNERDCKGILRSDTIAERAALGKSISVVRDCMEPHVELTADASLFDAIDVVRRYGYTLVRAADRRYSGIITAADLSGVLRTLAEPFLLLGEIENHLRRMVGERLSVEELQRERNPDDSRPVRDVADLSFGEYVRILQNPEYWNRLGTRLDRATFTESLEDTRNVRNDVMHFDPDGVAPNQLELLRRLTAMLQKLMAYEVI